MANQDISYADAVKAALVSAKLPSEVITPGNLEIARGCLVYAFNICSADKTHAVRIGAGTGKVLSRKLGFPTRQASALARNQAIVE